MDGFTIFASIARTTAAAVTMLPKAKRWYLVRRMKGEDRSFPPPGVDDVPFAPSEIDGVVQFLEDQGTKSFVAVLAAAILQRPGTDPTNRFSSSFKRMVDIWCVDRGQTWQDRDGALLKWIVSELTEVTGEAAARVDVRNSADEASIRELAVVSADLGAVADMETDIHMLRTAMSSPGMLQMLSHLDVTDHLGENPDHVNLYVERRLSVRGSNDDSFPSSELLARKNRRACVLTGNPGAGKSTLVRHLQREGLSDPDLKTVRLVVNCRDYVNEGWDNSLREYLGMFVRTRYQTELSESSLRAGLCLGYIDVIFDGLDEVLQLQMRQLLVGRIEAFARIYSMTGVLVTSRSVGYERSAFRVQEFTRVELDEFNGEQIEEYVHKWYAATGAPRLAAPFLDESRSISDVRRNPLMLSLLCSLFAAEGAIPRNRLHIYEGCADLLFNRWDGHRQLRVQHDVPDYGKRLMQEVASIFFTHQSAQGGVQERQLKHMVATYYADLAGVDRDVAQERVGGFLDYCADRGWLLVVLDRSESGERILGFAHRTFYEYFASLALVRRNRAAAALAEELIRRYEADPTSVLPELLIQAYDEATERGGSELFGQVLKASPRPDLVLRLFNVALKQSVQDAGFAYLNACIDQSPRVARRELLLIPPDPLFRLRESFGKGAYPRLLLTYQNAVAERMLRSRGDEEAGRWAAQLEEVHLRPWNSESGGPYDILRATVPESRLDPSWKELVQESEDGYLWSVWPSQLLGIPGYRAPAAVVTGWVERINAFARGRRQLSRPFMIEEGRVYGNLGSELVVDGAQARSALLATALACLELGFLEGRFRAVVEGVLEFPFDQALELRQRGLRGGQVRSVQRLVPALNSYPDWAAAWVRGSRVLVTQSHLGG